jgi:hypothetical protein
LAYDPDVWSTGAPHGGMAVATLAFALATAACSPRVLVVVGTDPCADGGGVLGCAPGLLDDLIGYWQLDDGPGSVVARDASGRGNHGTLHQLDPATAWVQGRAGTGVNVAGQGWIAVASSDSIGLITDRVTVSAWVSLEGTIVPDPGSTDVGWATALSRQRGTALDQHYHLGLTLDERPHLFVVPAGGFVSVTAPDPVVRATWVHIAGVYDGVEARVFVDGTLASRQAVSGRFAMDSTPVIIGGNYNNAGATPTELFPGRLDEVMLYRRALSDEEIRQLADGRLFPGTSRDAGSGN